LGARVVGASDVYWGVYAKDELDVSAAVSHAADTGRPEGLPGAEPVSNEDLLRLSCAVLVSAARDGTITCGNESQVQARLVVEAANVAVTHGGDAALAARGVPIGPDILPNAGGVIASYFEWVQDSERGPCRSALQARPER